MVAGRVVEDLARLHERSAGGEPVPVAWAPLFAIAWMADRWPRRVKRWIYASGLLPRTRLPAQVVAVGNLTVGGSGKTPLAQWVARQAHALSLPVAVLTRGWGRRAPARHGWATLVASGDGPLVGPASAGDEAWVHATQLERAWVIAGRVRASTGALAVRLLGARDPRWPVVVLDDAFQYVRLARDLEVVALAPPLTPAVLRPFPWGRLRDPLEELARADLIVLTHSEVATAQELALARELSARHCPRGRLALGRLDPVDLEEIDPGGGHGPMGRLPLPALEGQRVVAMCGIGCPDHFVATLEGLGATVVRAPFPDHHSYSYGDLERVGALARQVRATAIVTTVKDCANLPAGVTPSVPLWVLGVAMSVAGEGFDVEAWLASRLTSSS